MRPEELENSLILGARGMVGSYFDFGLKTDIEELDVTDLEKVFAFTSRLKPRIIVHLAAETDVDRCEKEPDHAYRVNSMGTYNVALASRKIGAKVVYVSTAGVFDGNKKEPYTEEDQPNPQNVYGRSKYLGEVMVKDLAPEYLIARSCWMFGGGRGVDKKFVSKIIEQFDKGEIKVVNDKIGSLTYGKDLAATIKQLLIQNQTGLFHLSNRGFCSRYEVAREIVKILGVNTTIIPVNSGEFKLAAPRVASEAMASKLNVMRDWREALQEYLLQEWKPYLKL
jgi:dTDP-4-dehydrorhamnose reductase